MSERITENRTGESPRDRGEGGGGTNEGGETGRGVGGVFLQCTAKNKFLRRGTGGRVGQKIVQNRGIQPSKGVEDEEAAIFNYSRIS